MSFHVQEKSTSQGLPYDFESVMHFRQNALSTRPKKNTIIPKSTEIPSSRLGTSINGTILDFLHVNLLYCGGEF